MNTAKVKDDINAAPYVRPPNSFFTMISNVISKELHRPEFQINVVRPAVHWIAAIVCMIVLVNFFSTMAAVTMVMYLFSIKKKIVTL